MQRILRLDLKLHPYKILLVQKLKASDFKKRLEFVNVMLDIFRNIDNILFSDEAFFHLYGCVNK